MNEYEATILVLTQMLAKHRANEIRLAGEVVKANEIIASISAKAEPEVPEVQLASAL